MPSGVYKRKPRTPEHCAALSKAQKGVPKKPFTPERCAAISEAKKGIPHTSEAQLAADEALRGVPLSPERCAAAKRGQEKAGVYEAMRGGNDLVDHHYIYDHSDLSLNIVQMTRKDHMRLHRLLQKLKYIVPHINVEDKS